MRGWMRSLWQQWQEHRRLNRETSANVRLMQRRLCHLQHKISQHEAYCIQRLMDLEDRLSTLEHLQRNRLILDCDDEVEPPSRRPWEN